MYNPSTFINFCTRTRLQERRNIHCGGLNSFRQITTPFFWCLGDKLIISQGALSTSHLIESKDTKNMGHTPRFPANFETVMRNKAIMSSFTPYISKDIKVGNSFGKGRGLFAMRNLAYDKEIMRLCAFSCQGDGSSLHNQVMRCVHDTLKVLNDLIDVKCCDEKSNKSNVSSNFLVFWYYIRGVLNLLCQKERVPIITQYEASQILKEFPKLDNFLSLEGNPTDVVLRIASVYEFCRFDTLYAGRNGRAIFPEASLFNHSCSPNVGIEIICPIEAGMLDVASPRATFGLVARTLRPIDAGEELFVTYLSDSSRPISLQQEYLKQRWHFECDCSKCRARQTSSTFVVVVISMSLVYWGYKKLVSYFLMSKEKELILDPHETAT